MKSLILNFICIVFASYAIAGPPEPPEAPAPPAIDLDINSDSLRALHKELQRIDTRLKGFDNLIRELDEDIHIKNLSISGDSIRITLDNDSVFMFRGLDSLVEIQGQDDIVRVGSDVTVSVGEEIDGDIIVVSGDVTVDGKVNGGVIVIGGDIYVSSTGFIQEAAVAFSGKVKQEPGARVGNLKISVRETGDWDSGSRATYRIMGFVFIIIFAIWWALAATGASLFKNNIKKIIDSITISPIKSYFKGYLAYIIAFGLFIGLVITLIGIPLAFVGVPLLTLAAMIISSAAICVIIGQRLLNTREVDFRTFIFGSLVLGIIPGLLFLVQLIFGSMLAMIFNWILISIFVLVIVPIGMGGVLSTRFGTRPDKNLAQNISTDSQQNIA